MQRVPLIHNPLLTRRRFLQLTAIGAASAATLGTGLSAHASGRAEAPKRGGVLRLGQTGDVLSAATGEFRRTAAGTQVRRYCAS